MIFYTYKAQKEKTMELSKKREGGRGPASTAGSRPSAEWPHLRRLAREAGVACSRGVMQKNYPPEKIPKLSQTGSSVEIRGEGRRGGGPRR